MIDNRQPKSIYLFLFFELKQLINSDFPDSFLPPYKKVFKLSSHE